MAKEYIEREAFIEDIKTEISNLHLNGWKGTPIPHDELYSFIDRINEQPAADVAEVVRCGECERRSKSADLTDTVYCPWLKQQMRKTDFCSYGERRDN